jgi:ribonuclease P/MRP protein subunit RPP1
MFYDLNVPYTPNDPEILHTLAFLAERTFCLQPPTSSLPRTSKTLTLLLLVEYRTVALSQSISGKFPSNLSPPQPPQNAPKCLTFLTRLNLTLSDPSQNQRLTNLAQSYSLIALRPMNEKCLSLACTNLDCDIISLDLSTRLPYHFKFKTIAAAVARGVRFEISYSPGITGSGPEARRNLFSNAMALIRATRGRGIIISSEAKRALGVRAPWDVVNMACVWGLTQERAKEAVCEEARKVVALAGLKRTSWRGIVDVVHGGERETEKAAAGAKKIDEAPSSKNGNGVKRKASADAQLNTEAEKPISKREMKRRAKRARFEAAGIDTNMATAGKLD